MKYLLKLLPVRGLNDSSKNIKHDFVVLTMTNRMMEEKEQINEQMIRADKLLQLIEMSLHRKNET